jgi:hypothetical protein
MFYFNIINFLLDAGKKTFEALLLRITKQRVSRYLYNFNDCVSRKVFVLEAFS